MSIVKRINKLRSDIQKELNNTYIWNKVALNALDDKSNDTSFLKKIDFRVPRTNNKDHEGVKRDEEAAKELMSNAIKYDIYYSHFTYIIAQFEAFLSDLLYEVLRYDPRKLLEKINGISHKSTISVSKVVLSDNKEQLIEELIKAEVTNIFYASPKKQYEYFEKVLNIKIDFEYWSYWFNYKAKRDIIVHNRGVVNSIYNAKVTEVEKKDIGDRIIINHEYYCNTIRNLKSLAGKINTSVRMKYGNEG